MKCAVCDAPANGGQFCVDCGAPLSTAMSAAASTVGTRRRPRSSPGAWLALQEIRLVACPRCGAPNSAARWRCARCGAGFDEDQEDAPAQRPVEEPAAVQPESARWLALITAVVGVAVVAVAVLMLAARGVGPFGTPDAPTAVTQAGRALVERVEASTAADGDGAAEHLVDGDPATAWVFELGASGEQWVELHLDQPVQIDHLLVWNGHQRDDETFATRNRVKSVLIEFPNADRAYEVEEFPDGDANFRIDMRDPPVSDVIRLTVNGVYGDPSRPVALSEIETLVASSSAP